MILSFKTQIEGRPTYFVDKIWKSLRPVNIAEYVAHIDGKYLAPYWKRTDINAKLHTIRQDKTDRWEKDVMIDFFINARQKDMFRFAPRIPVISTQDIFMTVRGSHLEISIAKVGSYMGGEDFMLDSFQQGALAKNDGFDEYDDFRRYFINAIQENGKATGNYWFSGKIIHWTDFKY